MMRKSKAFHSLDSLTKSGAASQALELTIQSEKQLRRLSTESAFSTSSTTISDDGESAGAFDITNVLFALKDVSETFPTIAWNFEES